MAFELVIAAKRDPAETAEELQGIAPPRTSLSLPVATIDVNGVFSKLSARELARSIENVLHTRADTVIIRFQEIACEDQSLVDFAYWIEELRRHGNDVRVAAGEPHVHALLAEKVISPDAVMHPAEVDAVAGRRVIDAHR